MVENAYVMVLIRLWLTFLIKKYPCGLLFLQHTHTQIFTSIGLTSHPQDNSDFIPINGIYTQSPQGIRPFI